MFSLIFSVAKLGYHCLDPMSESCVWGKAYRSIGIPLETVVFGAAAFGVVMIVAHMMRRHD